jgi:putative RNA 2'-phosphotransferase
MSDILHCPDHGYFDAQTCPVCGAEGTHVLSSSKRKKVSKFISGALRHFPNDVGLELDTAGWTSMGLLIDQTKQKYDWIDVQAIEAIVATDPKGRFEVDGERIRAAYGHSVDVELESGDSPVPRNLYHGTAPENVTDILSDGLRPMSRQHVHLTDSVDEARNVGERHAVDAVVLRIDAARMLSDGWDITKRGKFVYTTEKVPPVYITRTK